jgi:phytoene/squalene synthetase
MMIQRRVSRIASIGLSRWYYPSVSLSRLSTTHQRFATTAAVAIANSRQLDEWLEYCIATVRKHDPDSVLPGHLLAWHNPVLKTAYFAIRAFWVETGLRFGSTASVPPNATPADHLTWWQDGIDRVVFADATSTSDTTLGESATTTAHEYHPVLQLLQSLKIDQGMPWSKQHFDNVLQGRHRDLDVKQYDTLADLTLHAELSCGNLTQLVLQSAHLLSDDHPAAHAAARHMGMAHGLVNALRFSIPLLSTTGKLVIPADLTVRHGVRSPRYLLSALSMGDAQCERALQACVSDMAAAAREHLVHARAERVQEEPRGRVAAACLLPILASERFLERLHRYDYQLTNRNLRNSGLFDPAFGAAQTLTAFVQGRY